MLKAWALLGAGVVTRGEHMKPTWKQTLLNNLKDGFILPEADLDAVAAATADDLDCEVVSPFGVQLAASSSSRRRVKAKTSDVLGPAGSGVPPEIHAGMQRLAASGDLPITTLEQRSRNQRTPGTTYGTPQTLRAALQHGYIHPNLPAPRGMEWRARAGTWCLKVKGG